MRLFFSFLFLSFFSFAAYSEQGTWSTDDTATSQGDASLSGTDQEEEVQLIEKEEYDPMEDPIVIEPQEQEDERGRFDEVDESTP